MAHAAAGPQAAIPGPRDSFGGLKLQTALGTWGVALAAVSIAVSFTLPFITTAFRETYPITDSWVMPVIMLVVVDIAALVNLLAILWKKERSLTSLIVTVVMGAIGFFVTAMVVGEGLAGV